MMGLTNKSPRSGFTIVELLIVIVVIAILAAITLVSYNGIQKRANDAKRISDINSLTKGMLIWTVDTGKPPTETGGGHISNGQGWVYASIGSNYSDNIETVLINAGYLSDGVRDPKNPTGTGSYMFYRCSAASHRTSYSFFARLESPDKVSNDFERWQNMGCSYPSDAYGMNYAKLFVVN